MYAMLRIRSVPWSVHNRNVEDEDHTQRTGASLVQAEKLTTLTVLAGIEPCRDFQYQSPTA